MSRAPTPERRARAERVARALGVMFVESRVPIIGVLPDGSFIAANQAAMEQYGYSLDELLGMRIHDLIAIAYGSSELDIDGDLATVTGAHTPLGRRPHRRKDGSIVWVTPTAGPIIVDGETVVVSILTDVTVVLEAERKVSQLEKRAETDRERADALWQAASQWLADGVALLDEGLRVVYCNKALAGMLGMPAESAVGVTCRELFPTCKALEPCHHRRALSEGRRIAYEVIGVVSRLPLKIEAIPAIGTPGFFALVHTAHDLTEERAIRSRLVTADRLASIGRIAAGVAHEINNPAAFVTVNLGVLRDWFASGAPAGIDVLPLLDESLAGMDRIRDIVRDLKGFARERSKDKVDLTALVGSATRMAAHEVGGRARLEKHLEPGLFAHVRGARVAQVVLNLLVNAAQAIAPGNVAGNRIVVRTWRERDRAKIEVTDTGSGIPEELAAHIYEPFFTTRESAGGTGLGLWLARAILEEEGGGISSSNVAAGGARFVVDLPACEPTEQTILARGAGA